MHLKLGERVSLSEEENGEIRLTSSWSTLSWKNATPALRFCLRQLAEKGAHEESLIDELFEEEGDHSLALLYHALAQMKERAFLLLTPFWQESPFITLRPIAPHYTWHEDAVDETEPFVLTPYTSSFQKNGECIMETPLNAAYVILRSPESISLIKALKQPIQLNQLYQALPHLPKDLITHSLKLLKSAKILRRRRSDER
ncbi:MAG: hypothetical protein ACHQT8_07345 [Chlamydiales bacterium]